MSTKNKVIITDYHNGGGDLEFEVSEGFGIDVISRNGTVKSARLTVSRKPDKNSTRLGMFAYLRTRPGYQSLGFSQIQLVRDTYSDDGKFIARVVYIFLAVGVESVLMQGDKEEIIFTSSGYNELSISKVGVSIKTAP